MPGKLHWFWKLAAGAAAYAFAWDRFYRSERRALYARALGEAREAGGRLLVVGIPDWPTEYG